MNEQRERHVIEVLVAKKEVCGNVIKKKVVLKKKIRVVFY